MYKKIIVRFPSKTKDVLDMFYWTFQEYAAACSESNSWSHFIILTTRPLPFMGPLRRYTYGLSGELLRLCMATPTASFTLFVGPVCSAALMALHEFFVHPLGCGLFAFANVRMGLTVTANASESLCIYSLLKTLNKSDCAC